MKRIIVSIGDVPGSSFAPEWFLGMLYEIDDTLPPEQERARVTAATQEAVRHPHWQANAQIVRMREGEKPFAYVVWPAAPPLAV